MLLLLFFVAVWISCHIFLTMEILYLVFIQMRDGIMSYCSARWFILYFPYFLFPLLCFILCPPLFNFLKKILSQDPISYLHAFMLKSIQKYRQEDIQMSAFYLEQKLPSQSIYKNLRRFIHQDRSWSSCTERNGKWKQLKCTRMRGNLIWRKNGCLWGKETEQQMLLQSAP